ncbi:MAG: sodium:proton antiporter [Bacteroidales bacterium]|nr:sodium:proton antiporter [Bacteroidales bacterium]
MKKIILFSVFLLLGLAGSQVFPILLGAEIHAHLKPFFDVMLYICLAFIMINVGREFELDKTKWKSYTEDYFIAMATAAVPWLLICGYFILLMPAEYRTDWGAWKETLLLSRFAAPTSAGILFTMLAAAGLKKSWVYQKTRVLAIFDDLDTILLMIPLQVLMIGMKWQLGVVVLFVFLCLYLGWTRLNSIRMIQHWSAILGYATTLVFIFQGLYVITKEIFGPDSAIHIEILLPAFVLGMMMKTKEHHTRADENASSVISYMFMFLVGLSAPLFVGVDFGATAGNCVIGQVGDMTWGEIAGHVLVTTALSNIGKLLPLFFYRDRSLTERLALSIGMFTRGEVGAGIVFIALGYGLGGPLLAISLLTILTNLILTGFFVVIVKALTMKADAAKH